GLSKEPRHPKMDGVSTNLALIFGTLLSSQGTHASFVLTLSGFPPGFPSCFQPYQIVFRSVSGSEFEIRWPVGCLSPLGVVTTLADFIGGS
ncbi:hypothetical protein ACGFZH_35220, partial [Streptomyces zaomyceticus]|uniref:hypothetical protein n=1 Tax=Streptomyces zaomyceticus TaxID=68286 RepID=UPI003723548F